MGMEFAPFFEILKEVGGGAAGVLVVIWFAWQKLTRIEQDIRAIVVKLKVQDDGSSN